MIVDVLIRSYYRDVRWLRICLAAVHSYLTGYRRVLLIVPASSQDRIPDDTIPCGLPIELIVCSDYLDDYVGQQITKLHADHFTDAEYIFHLDADVIFYRKCHVAELFSDGLPVYVFRRRSARALFDGWRQSIRKCLSIDTEIEFMVMQPVIYPRWLYEAARDECQKHLGRPLAAAVIEERPDRFSEFSVFGAYAWYHHSEAFTWVEIDEVSQANWPCRWFWGRRGITAEVISNLPIELRRVSQ